MPPSSESYASDRLSHARRMSRDGFSLPIGVPWTMLLSMVTLTDEDTAAIQRAYDESGELSAAIEVTRRFQAIQGERARE